MKSAVFIAFLMALAASGGAEAQSRFNLSLTPSTPPASQPQVSSFAMPVIDYVPEDGRSSTRRGVIAGVDVGPGASLGLGIFEGAPKRRVGAVDPAKPEKNSKRAAVGFSLKF